MAEAGVEAEGVENPQGLGAILEVKPAGHLLNWPEVGLSQGGLGREGFPEELPFEQRPGG